MPVFWHPTSDLWFLDSVKRVLAAVEAPVVPAKGWGRLRRCLSDAVRVFDAGMASEPRAVLAPGSCPLASTTVCVRMSEDSLGKDT